MKKIIAVLVLVAAVLCFMPANTAFAADEPRIHLGIDGVGAGDNVYFGWVDNVRISYATEQANQAVPWRVLNNDTTGNKAFLLSEYLLGIGAFTSSSEYAITYYYDDCALWHKMDALYNGQDDTLFTSGEQGAIAATDIGEMYSSNTIYGAHLFPLSHSDVTNSAYFADDAARAAYYITDKSQRQWWWLRTSISFAQVYSVSSSGSVELTQYYSETAGFYVEGIRPAFYLDSTKVLFTSAARDGKTSGALGADALSSTLTPSDTTQWKLTLKDSARDSFAIAATARSASSVTVNYSNAKTGANEYISAMIADNGAVTYYGRIKNLTNAASDAAGTVTVNIPSGVILDSDTILYIFNEQFNGDNTSATDAANVETDYSSELKAVPSPSLTFTDSAEYDIPAGAAGTAIAPVDVSGGVYGGTSPYTYSLSSNPTWLSIDENSGVISGTPDRLMDETTVTVQVTDSAAPTAAAKTITIKVGKVGLPLSITPSNTFVKGSAPSDLKLTLGEGLAGVGSDDFGGLTMDGNAVEMGADTFEVADGSIVVTFAQGYLNTLSTGRHTVAVTTTGAYAGATSAQITVTSGNPLTADSSNIFLWAGAMLLAGAAICVLVGRGVKGKNNRQ